MKQLIQRNPMKTAALLCVVIFIVAYATGFLASGHACQGNACGSSDNGQDVRNTQMIYNMVQ